MTDSAQPRPPGRVSLVGAGPGSPGLLTIRGAQCLREAEVVLYDHLANLQLLDYLPAGAERIFAGKSVGKCALPQDAINSLLVEKSRQGLRVVRLKGGDPYVFGRGAEEAEYLARNGIAFEIVPGVTAGVGVTSFAGIPITHRDAASAVAFITGHDDPEADSTRLDWPALAQFPGTLVVYMGVTRLAAVCRTLIREGKASHTPAALVESGTLPRQRTVVGTLADLADRVAQAGLRPPSLLVVGEVVSRRPSLNWFESLPLFGQRIVVTRPLQESRVSALELEALGAEVIIAPMIEVKPLIDNSELDSTIAKIYTYNWLVFTSMNGVRAFMDRLFASGRDARALGGIKIATIGPATTLALGDYHLKSDLVATTFRSEGLVAALREEVRGRRVLLARADRGRTVLADALVGIAEVDHVTVYRSVDAESLPDGVTDRILAGQVDWITLTSSAITERLHQLLPTEAQALIGTKVKLASLSPLTTAAANRLGWQVVAEPAEATWDALMQSIVHELASFSAKDAEGEKAYEDFGTQSGVNAE